MLSYSFLLCLRQAYLSRMRELPDIELPLRQSPSPQPSPNPILVNIHDFSELVNHCQAEP